MPWYAVQTQPRREEVAETHLRRLCAQVCCPRYRQRVILHGYRREVARPLFPGYLFAAFDWARVFRAVHYAHGVRCVVTFGGKPAEVPATVLASLEARMTNGYVVVQPAPLKDGQRVEIIAGPFKGFTGVFDAHRSSAERVAILLDTLKYNARMMVDRAAIRVP
ncbi:MAG: transcription termination/antitermination protein NusG [Candidatus Binatia bacterium]